MNDVIATMYNFYFDNFMNISKGFTATERAIEYGTLKAMNLMMFLNDDISKATYLETCEILRTTAESFGVLESKGRKLE